VPTQPYYFKDGVRAPSVTTIIGARKFGVDGLIGWAYKMGKEGKCLDEARTRACSAGSLAHDMIEQYVNGTEPFIPEPNDGSGYDVEMIRLARQGFESFMEWFEQSRINIIETEMPLVSELFRFGGCPDAVGMQGEEVCLLDWKISNAVYHDYLYQLAAYKQLVEENRDLKITRVHLCRFSKDYGDYHHHSFSMERIAEAWHGFLTLREMYDVDKKLRRAI
jgi:hypothetical protein